MGTSDEPFTNEITKLIVAVVSLSNTTRYVLNCARIVYA